MRLAIGEILRCSSRSWHRPNAEFTLPNSMRPPIVLSRVGAQQAVPFFVPIHENVALRFVYSQVFRVDIQKMPSLSGPRLLLVPVVPVWRRRLSLCSPGKNIFGQRNVKGVASARMRASFNLVCRCWPQRCIIPAAKVVRAFLV